MRWFGRTREDGGVTSEADLPDEDLVRLAQRDPEAFGRLYERYAPEIEGFVRSRVRGDREVAQDITSQVFTKAFTALPRYTKGPFRAWLYQIARNTLIDEHRRKRPVTTIDEFDDLVSHDASLEDQVIASEARDRLHGALGQLTSSQRDVVYLRLQGYTTTEIGKQLGLSTEAVRSVQHRAFVKLRTYLREQR